MKRLHSRPALCVNCRICVMSCSLEKSGVFNPAKARIWIHRNKKGQDAPMNCRHCINAPCEKSCPVEVDKPIWRDNEAGIVRIALQTCIGCYECVEACPFVAMRVDAVTSQVFKCDLCEGDPECVKWCPTGAIRYADTKAIGALTAAEKV